MDNSDDEFSDDGFDDLPPGTLLRLEQNAYKATQAQGALHEQHHVSRPLQDDAQSHNGAHHDPSLSLTVPLPENQGLSSQYGDLDVGELDAMVLEDGDEVLGNDGAMEGLERHEASIRQPERHSDQATIPQPQPQPQERHYALHNGGNVHGELQSLSDEVAQLRARVEEVRPQHYSGKCAMADHQIA